MASSDADFEFSHSNTVTFTDLSRTISSITYVPDSLVISDGQPFSVPPSITQNGNVFQISLQAGRHKTTSVAEQFNELSGGRNSGFLSAALKTELELSSGSSAERAAIIAKFQTIQTRGQAREYIESVLSRAHAARKAKHGLHG